MMTDAELQQRLSTLSPRQVDLISAHLSLIDAPNRRAFLLSTAANLNATDDEAVMMAAHYALIGANVEVTIN